MLTNGIRFSEICKRGLITQLDFPWTNWTGFINKLPKYPDISYWMKEKTLLLAAVLDFQLSFCKVVLLKTFVHFLKRESYFVRSTLHLLWRENQVLLVLAICKSTLQVQILKLDEWTPLINTDKCPSNALDEKLSQMQKQKSSRNVGANC